MSCACMRPLIASASKSRKAAGKGPPKSPATAANAPASTRSRPSSSAMPAIRTPTTPMANPRASSGASGPSTIPNDSEMSAAGRMLTSSMGLIATSPRPSSGVWPPWPGSLSTAATRIPASPGTSSTYQTGGSSQSKPFGMSCHTSSMRSWRAVWKSTAAKATGMPRRAAKSSDRRYAFWDTIRTTPRAAGRRARARGRPARTAPAR